MFGTASELHCVKGDGHRRLSTIIAQPYDDPSFEYHAYPEEDSLASDSVGSIVRSCLRSHDLFQSRHVQAQETLSMDSFEKSGFEWRSRLEHRLE